MAEEFVPQGLPHGDRQETEVAMRDAGLALDLSEGASPVAPAPTPSPSASQGGGAPLDVDPLLALQPTGRPMEVMPQPSFRDQMMMVAMSSPSALARDMAERYLGSEEL